MPTPLDLGTAQHVDFTKALGIDLPSQTTDMPAEGMATILAAASSTVAAAVAAAATTTAATATSSSASPYSSTDAPEGECQLMGPFALFVQAALGALALLSLVYKRYRERPQRPLRIWFFDVSKQVFGSVLVHIANIFMSMLTSGKFSINAATASVQERSDDSYAPNPCSFYLLNLGIDTTLGIPILIILLKVITSIVAFTPVGRPRESIQSGHYGSPPNAWWWLKQSIIYFCGLFGMKICVLIIFLLMPWISIVGDWALSWTDGNEKLQIAFVMMIFPLVMNGLQYYIIDSFIKEKGPDHERVPSEESGNDSFAGYDGRLRTHDEDEEADESDSDFDGCNHSSSSKILSSSVAAEYDPDVDGVHPSVNTSDSSRDGTVRRKAALPEELYPKE